jgi:hypothetical protein
MGRMTVHKPATFLHVHITFRGRRDTNTGDKSEQPSEMVQVETLLSCMWKFIGARGSVVG